MFARSVSIRLKPNSVGGVYPADRKQNPSLASKAKVLPGRNHVRRPGREAVGISLWDQKENAEGYSGDGYPGVLKALENVVEGTPQVCTYEVANSTFHDIAARVAV